MRTLFARIVPSLAVVILIVGAVWGVCPKGDLTGDCEIDFMNVNAFTWR